MDYTDEPESEKLSPEELIKGFNPQAEVNNSQEDIERFLREWTGEELRSTEDLERLRRLDSPTGVYVENLIDILDEIEEEDADLDDYQTLRHGLEWSDKTWLNAPLEALSRFGLEELEVVENETVAGQRGNYDLNLPSIENWIQVIRYFTENKQEYSVRVDFLEEDEIGRIFSEIAKIKEFTSPVTVTLDDSTHYTVTPIAMEDYFETELDPEVDTTWDEELSDYERFDFSTSQKYFDVTKIKDGNYQFGVFSKDNKTDVLASLYHVLGNSGVTAIRAASTSDFDYTFE